ncbi:MAG: DUF7507 domain-containing protein [Solirubrobacteraceae bacterium]
MSGRARLVSRPWAGPLALLVPLVLVLAAFLAPVGQAHPAAQRTPEEEAAKAQSKLAEKEQRAAQRQAQRELRAQGRGAKTVGQGEERENGVVHITCTQVSWTFRSFPNLPANTVTERLSIDHQAPTFKTFTFDGPTGTDVVAINAPPGPEGAAYQIDAWGRWKTNGFRGAFDIHARVKCAPAPALSIEKLQRIVGSGGTFTSSPLSGLVGQTVEYEILATNTGNVPLSLSSFSDPRCDAGTSSGGPGSGQLAAGASTTYRCTHLLTDADRTAGSYSNAVSLTATPPEGEGSPISEESNTVVVEVPPSSTTHEEPTPPTTTTSTTTTGTTFTPLPPTPASGTLAGSTTQPPRSGVLAFSAAGVPRLHGPQGCVRGPFRASLKAAGVASVTFYLDGHKLRRLTAHSAHKGVLSIAVDPSKLSVGAHRLLARITMVKAPAASKAVTASRSVTVLRCRSAAVTPKFTG